MSLPSIPPVVSTDRPRWSVMIPARNAERFLASTLESVLAGGLPAGSQIEVVDDGSTDATRTSPPGSPGVASPTTATPSRAAPPPTSTSASVGRRATWSTSCTPTTRCVPGFYAAADAAFAGSDAVAVVVRAAYIDEAGRVTVETRTECPTGIWVDAVRTLAVSNRIRPPGIAVRRSGYEAVGGFRTDLHHAADWDMWVRLALHGPVWFEDRILARYRVHETQDTTARVRDAGNIGERVAALDLIAAQLPAGERRRALRRGLLYSSAFAGRTALRLARRRAWPAAGAQSLAAARCAVAAVVASPRLAVGNDALVAGDRMPRSTG